MIAALEFIKNIFMLRSEKKPECKRHVIYLIIFFTIRELPGHVCKYVLNHVVLNIGTWNLCVIGAINETTQRVNGVEQHSGLKGGSVCVQPDHTFRRHIVNHISMVMFGCLKSVTVMSIWPTQWFVNASGMRMVGIYIYQRT